MKKQKTLTQRINNLESDVRELCDLCHDMAKEISELRDWIGEIIDEEEEQDEEEDDDDEQDVSNTWWAIFDKGTDKYYQGLRKGKDCWVSYPSNAKRYYVKVEAVSDMDYLQAQTDDPSRFCLKLCEGED